MKKSLAVLALAAAAVASLLGMTPAQAATTSKQPKIVKVTNTFRCTNGKKATFHHEGFRTIDQSGQGWWRTTRETANNPCPSQWLIIVNRFKANAQTNCCVALSVAPGSKFDWKGSRILAVNGHTDRGFSASLQDSFACADGVNTWEIYRNGQVADAPACPANG